MMKMPMSTGTASSGRPSRDVSGEVRYTMRHECQLENVLGRRRLVGPFRRPVGRLERDLRAQRRRRPTGSALEPDHRSHRPQGGRALENLRPPPPPRGKLARARPQAQGKAPHLGRRGRRLLPQQRRTQARRIPVPRPAPLRRLDHLWPRTRALLDGNLRRLR